MIREHRGVMLAALLAAAAGAALEYRLNHPESVPHAASRTTSFPWPAEGPFPKPPEPGTSLPWHVVRLGQTVPWFALPDLQGRPLGLPKDYDYAGRLLVINFWATWCEPCVREMTELQRYSAQQPSNGVQVVGIALDDPAAVRAFLKTHPVDYPILLDRSGPQDSSVRLGDRAGVLPYSVLVSADGRLLKRQVGPFKPGEIDAWARPATASR